MILLCFLCSNFNVVSFSPNDYFVFFVLFLFLCFFPLHFVYGSLKVSPIVVAQNEKIDASMVNRVSCDRKQSDSSVAELTSDTVIEVSIEILFAFRPIPVQAIESTGTQVLEQILRIMLPCFMAQSQHDELESKFFEERASFEAK